MGKATIIEAQNSTTVYEEGSNKGILGKLKGVFADYKNGTRNADRLYTEELWDNRVFGSEDVMEALETKTLFGELDHPDGDRCETLAKNAAISITKLEKRPDEGVIYGEAEILDTPTGRIVKALADSGAKLGISSRGMGEEIFQEGKNIIDPETYDFITFDVVVTPANTKARVALTESKHLTKLTESLQKEINECETENQLNQVKTVLESVNIAGKESLLTAIDNKVNTLGKKVEVKLSEANKSIALNLLKEKYIEKEAQLKESLNANEQLAKENKQLIENMDFLKTSREGLKTVIKENNSKAEEDKAIQEEKLQEELDYNQVEITNLKKQIESLQIENKETILKMKAMNEKKIENLEKEYKETIKSLEEAKQAEISKFENLLKENKKLGEVLVEKESLLEESKKIEESLNNKVKEMENSIKANSAKLTESKKLEEDKIRALENKNIVLENRIKELEEDNTILNESVGRFRDLSFNPVGTVKMRKENFSVNNDIDADDMALFNALIGK